MHTAARAAEARAISTGSATPARASACRTTSTEQILRISQRQGLWVQRVRLYTVDTDWSCDCRNPDDPCAHVAAAVIALRRAHEEGLDLFESEVADEGRISYRFTRSQGRLALERVVKAVTMASRME